MQNVVVVLPGRRAVRTMQRLLAALAKEKRCALVPPILETIGSLPEQLYPAQRPPACELIQQVVWHRVLTQASPEQLAGLLRTRPAPQSATSWQLAEALSRLHTELAGEGYRFADVVRHWNSVKGESLPSSVVDRERQRWQVLSDLQDAYLRQMDDLGLWDPQTARLVAVERQECRTNRWIVLVGTVDVNQIARRMLTQVADHVIALVFAPQDKQSQFDEVGCLVPESWSEESLGFPEDSIEVLDGPWQQAQRVAEIVADWAPGYAPAELAIGVPDESLVPYLVRCLEDAGAQVRWGPGRRASDSRPARLLHAAAAYVQSRRFADFAALVRHPDVYDYLSRTLNSNHWLLQCDQYYQEHLPPHAGPPWLTDTHAIESLCQAWQIIQRWLEPLGADALPPQQWCDVIIKVLEEIYSNSILSVTSPECYEEIESFRAIQRILTDVATIPSQLEPSLSREQLIHFISDYLSNQLLGAAPRDNAVELLGWLDLPLDTDRATIVTTFNEGFIPSSVNADVFLPNTLRRRLGLLDNQRRLARDVYAVRLLLESRERVKFLVARRDANNDTLTVSRLALMAPPRIAAERVCRFLETGEPGEHAGAYLAPVTVQPSRSSRFVVPPPEGVDLPSAIPVTALATYLQCPYRFYLKHILRLEAVEDTAEELGPAEFGSLLHAVLRRYAESGERDQRDPETIYQQLQQFLEEEALRLYGTVRLPAVQVQVAQIRRRLRGFADWQSRWIEQGWRIRWVERRVELPATEIPGIHKSRLRLVGRIDRIDENVQTGKWAVLDYKSSDKPRDPNHALATIVGPDGTRLRQWVDLQLPAYRHLARAVDAQLDGVDLVLGYISVPSDPTRAGDAIADWDAELLEEADRTLQDILERIERGEFWPPEQLGSTSDEYAWICQETALERRLGK